MISIEEVKNIVLTELKKQDSIFLVDIRISAKNEIVVEIDSNEGISIDTCINLSKLIEEKLDREKEDFELEVGSSGLTSPLKIPRQYQKYIGKELEVIQKNGVKLTGELISANDESFVLQISKLVKLEGAKRKSIITEDIELLYSDIKQTKYKISVK